MSLEQDPNQGGGNLEPNPLEVFLEDVDLVWDLLDRKFQRAAPLNIEFYDLTSGFGEEPLDSLELTSAMFEFSGSLLGVNRGNEPVRILLFESGLVGGVPIKSIIVNRYTTSNSITKLLERVAVHVWPNGVVEFSGELFKEIDTNPTSLRQDGQVLLFALPGDTGRVKVFHDDTKVSTLPNYACDYYAHGIDYLTDEELELSSDIIQFAHEVVYAIRPGQDQITRLG